MVRKAKRKWSWKRQVALLNSAIILALWRWRTQRLLLLITGLGMTIAVVLVAALPLFSTVMSTAGLRGVLRAQSNSAQVLAEAQTMSILSSDMADASSEIGDVVKNDVGRYVSSPPQTTVITGNWGGPLPTDFYGVPIQTARTHLQLLQGRLPAAHTSSASSIEIMLTRSAALYMGNLKVGDTVPLTARWLPDSRAFNNVYTNTVYAHLVGIFRVNANDAYWNGRDLEEPPPVGSSPPPAVLALTDQVSLLHMLDSIAGQHTGVDGIYFNDGSLNSILFSYTLNTAAITSDDLDDLIARLGTLQQDFSDFRPFNITIVRLSGPPVHSLQMGSEGDSTLEKYRSQMQVTRTPLLVLSAEIFCLVLFFVSVTVSALVEREQAAIAVLRSRGANRGQVFGSLLAQGVILCVLAGLIGPLLALGLVLGTASHFLTAMTQDALNALTLHLPATLRSLSLYTLAAVLAAFLTLLLTIYIAVRANILTLRREGARATRLPLWQRLRLDLVVALLAVVGYALILYLGSNQQLLSTQSQILVSTPLKLLAPLLLLIAGILCFLRLFPLVLRLLARLSQRRRGLTPMLALAQMERTPRQSLRMALLLGLAMAFALFSLVFSASQDQRAQDLATYQAVSDFSGYNLALPATTPAGASTTLNQLTARYQRIKGVTAASVGSRQSVYLFINANTAQAYAWPTQLFAVDASTFARTAFWSAQDSSQSLANLMALLVARRAQAEQQGVVPALVAANTWQLLGLSPGATFHIVSDQGTIDPTVYQAVAEVNHIPPVDDGSAGALLVDYQSLLHGQEHAHVQSLAQPNYVWLRTSDDPALVNGVRTALADPSIALASLADRRALSGSNAADPLANELLSILSIGVVCALLLALLANLLLPLLSVRMRQTNFAVLRALGTAPGQVRNILTYELAIVLATSLLLGLLFGALLALTSVSPLVFTGALPASLVSISSNTIYTLQQIVPVQIILPPSLLLALLALLALCVLALSLMARLAQRPLLAQALRLNED